MTGGKSAGRVVGRPGGADDGTAAERLAAAVANEASRQLGRRPAPGLHVVATPIGNLGDMTIRALAVLATADVVLAEDTRHARTLLSHFAINRALEAYHEHNAEKSRPGLLTRLAEGRSVALMSDAGTPLVSDPGYKLVRAAVAAGHQVYALPGASALLAGIVTAGLPTDTVLFTGFPPARGEARARRIGELAAVQATIVLYEAPGRLAETLADLAAMLPDREGAVARELTKLFEETRRGPLGELAAWAAAEQPRGEMVVLVGPPAPSVPDDGEIAERLSRRLDAMGLSAAAREVAAELGVAKARVYRIGVALKGGGGDDEPAG